MINIAARKQSSRISIMISMKSTPFGKSMSASHLRIIVELSDNNVYYAANINIISELDFVYKNTF